MNVLQKVILFIGMLVGLLGLVSCGNDESDIIPGEVEDTEVLNPITASEVTTTSDDEGTEVLVSTTATIPGGEVADTEVLVPITASEVTDQASLKAFALNAKAHLEENYELAIEDFDKEKWQKCYSYYVLLTQCSTYLYVLDMDKEVFAFRPSLYKDLEGLPAKSAQLKHFEELKKVAQVGGGFVKHSGDEDAASYAVLFENEGESHILVAVYVQKEQDTEQSEEDSSE